MMSYSYCLTFLGVLFSFSMLTEAYPRHPMYSAMMMDAAMDERHGNEDRGCLLSKLFECGRPGMPPCNAEYARSLATLFRQLADGIDERMVHLMMMNAQLHSRSFLNHDEPVDMPNRGLFGDMWGKIKNHWLTG